MIAAFPLALRALLMLGFLSRPGRPENRHSNQLSRGYAW